MTPPPRVDVITKLSAYSFGTTERDYTTLHEVAVEFCAMFRTVNWSFKKVK